MHELLFFKSSLHLSSSTCSKGFIHGSPAFRRKKRRRARSEINLLGSKTSVSLRSGPKSQLRPLVNANGIPLRSSKDNIVHSRKYPLVSPATLVSPSTVLEVTQSTLHLSSSSVVRKDHSPTRPVSLVVRDDSKDVSSNLAPTAKFRSDGEISIHSCAPQKSAIFEESAKNERTTSYLVKDSQKLREDESINPREILLKRKSTSLPFHESFPFSSKKSSNVKNESGSKLLSSFFNRFTSLRRSFNRDRNVSSKAHPLPSHQSQPLSLNSRKKDSDWIFFRGFHGKHRLEKYNETDFDRQISQSYLPHSQIPSHLTILPEFPIAPPRRKRISDRDVEGFRNRSLSFTDAHFIAQAVLEGDVKLIEELYPDFPRSEPIYAAVDLAKKRKQNRLSPITGSSNDESEDPRRHSALPSTSDIVTFTNTVLFVENKNEKENDEQNLAFSNSFTLLTTPKSEKKNFSHLCSEEPSPLISPWNNGSSLSQNDDSVKKSSFIHPFAQRAVNESKNHRVSITSSRFANGGVTLSPTYDSQYIENSFTHILDSADNSISQAESILFSLHQNSSLSNPQIQNSKNYILDSDIEINIRRLEETQAKINEALQTFRSVQKNSDVQTFSLRTKSGSLEQETLVSENGVRSKKGGKIFRRHSFTNPLLKDKSSRQDFSLVYEGDIDSDVPLSHSSANLDADFSDSEIRALHERNKYYNEALGTFGLKKRQEGKKGRDFEETIGNFTRQIENLSTNASSSSSSHYYSPEDHVSSSSGGSSSCETHKELVSKYSNDTFTSSLSSRSNRNSLNSGQSLTSESYEDDDEEEEAKEDSTTSSSSNSRIHNDVSSSERTEKKVYYIAREIMTSERVFVDVLKLLNIEFREFIHSAKLSTRSVIISDSDFSRIFSNLHELQTLNEDLLQDFEDRIQNWDSLKKIADVIVKKGPFLKLYTSYIREFSSVNFHFDECMSKYSKFAKLVREFERKPRCKNLQIKHYMLKPVQRLPQYKLLLEDYLKHLNPNSIDFEDTTNALRIVSDAAEHANDTIRQGDKFRQMLKLQSRLGHVELIRPGRDLIKEGELQKISRKGIGSRYFVLLSDCLLINSITGSWSGDSNFSLRLNYKIPLDRLTVRVATLTEDSESEFTISSPIRSCTLRASSLMERNDWVDALNTAIEDLLSRQSSLRSTRCDSADEAVVGHCAPIWIPDRRVTMCQVCNVEFTVLFRRHHCRACGKVICSSCSSNKAPLQYRDYESGRVCDDCYISLETAYGHIEYLKTRFKKRVFGTNHQVSSMGNKGQPERFKRSREGSQMSGYLKKRQSKTGKWKRNWYVLKDRVLYSYKASEDTVAVQTFPVLGFKLDTLSDKNFELYEGEYAGHVFQLTHPGSESLVFCADNDNVSEKWITALTDAIHLQTQL